jgi:hypothetical protein|tara:strand:+ start:223 stop:447 length:225 start_codon:yes stop_codon:yes gene_type:complete
MGNLHNELSATYSIAGKPVYVVLCWQGKNPEDDPDRFYDIFDNNGICLNLGEPWHDDDRGVPSACEIETLFEVR